MYVGQFRIRATSGVHQGDPLGPLLFALAVHPLVLSLRARFPNLIQAWFLDDGSVLGAGEEVSGVLGTVIREGPQYGVFLNLPKTKVWWPQLSARVVASLPSGIGACLAQGVRLLGGVVSTSADFVRQFVHDKAVQVCLLMDRLAELADPQSELLLLRACVGVCKLLHVLRCTPPSLVDRGVEVFDASLHLALRRIAVGDGGGFGPLQDELAALPLCMGGLGVLRGSDIQPYAFLASALQTRGLQDDILGGWEVPHHPEVPFAREMFLSHVGQFDADLLDNPEFTQRGLQGKLGLALGSARRDFVLASPALPRLREVVASNSLPHASAWLLALPVPRSGQAMLPIDFSCRLKYSLFIPIYSVGAVCPCCSSPMDRWGDHAVQCRQGKGVAVTYRHNVVRDLLYRLAKDLGLDVAREPHFPVRVPGAEGRRPDLVFREWEGGRDLYLDVVGSSPLSATNVVGFVPGGAYDRAVARKEASYREILRAQPSSVLLKSFAFEALGGLHADALGVVMRLQGVVNLAAATHDDCIWFSVVRRVSFAISKAVGRQLSSRLSWWGGPSFR